MARSKRLNSKGRKISKETGPRFPTRVLDLDFNAAGYPVISATAAALLRKLYNQKPRPAQPDLVSGMAPYSHVPFAQVSFIIAHWFLETALNETAMFLVRRTYIRTKRFASEADAVKQLDSFFLKSMSSPTKKIEDYDRLCGTQISNKTELMDRVSTICAIRDLLYHHEANGYQGGNAPACVAKLFEYLPEEPNLKSWIIAGWSPVLGSKSTFDFIVKTLIDFTNTMSIELGHKHHFRTIDHLAKKPGIASLCNEPGLIAPIKIIKTVQKEFSTPRSPAKVVAFDGTRRGNYYLFIKNKKHHVIHVSNRGRKRNVPAWEIEKIKKASRIGWIPIPWKGMEAEMKQRTREKISDIEPYPPQASITIRHRSTTPRRYISLARVRHRSHP